jgi:nucleotide-binding universal stress UspA family protein
MKKLLLLIDENGFTTALKNALRLVEGKGGIYTKVLFLQGIPGENSSVEKGEAAIITYPSTIAKTKAILEAWCISHKIECRVEEVKVDEDWAAVVKETVYADLMIVPVSLFREAAGGSDVLAAEKLLHRSKCSVLVVPEHFGKIETVLVTYNGSASSMYAAKQFIQCFPAFCQLPTTLIISQDEDFDRGVYRSVEGFNTYMEVYCNKLSVVHVPALSSEQVEDFAARKLFPVVVTGAYGRPLTALQQKESFARYLVIQNHTPVFIAHR